MGGNGGGGWWPGVEAECLGNPPPDHVRGGPPRDPTGGPLELLGPEVDDLDRIQGPTATRRGVELDDGRILRVLRSLQVSVEGVSCRIEHRHAHGPHRSALERLR
jgi:hypothetical protein